MHKLSLQYLVRINTNPSPGALIYQFMVQAKTLIHASASHLALLSCSCLVIDPHRVDSLMLEWPSYSSHKRGVAHCFLLWTENSSLQETTHTNPSSRHWIISLSHIFLLCLFSYVLIRNPSSSPHSLYSQFVASSFHHSVTAGHCGFNPLTVFILASCSGGDLLLEVRLILLWGSLEFVSYRPTL